MDLEADFKRIYANLPLSARKEVIVVIDKEPLTWNSAWVEIDNNTDKGKEILKKLSAMRLLDEQEAGR